MAGPRIGLVLGAGGILGAAWITGILEGFRRATGFEVPDAALTVGTSAGAFIGAMLSTGVPAAALYGGCTGEMDEGLQPHLRDLADHIDRQHIAPWLRRFPVNRGLRRPLLTCPQVGWRGLRERSPGAAGLVLAGLAGDGLFHTANLGRLVRSASHALQERVVAYGWPHRPLWIVSVDLDRGERVVFGRDGPLVELDAAVRASAAIPGLFTPERIEGRRHVDGGVWSTTNLDLLAGLDLDLILVLSPLSGGRLRTVRAPGPWWQKVGMRMARGVRRRVDRLLEQERELVHASGTPVVVLHPGAEEIAAMPFHCMSVAERGDVMRRAAARIQGALREDPRWRPVRAMLQEAIWPREAWLRRA